MKQIRKVKVLIYYKKEIADLEKARRNEKIKKAQKYLQDNPGIVKMSSNRLNNKYLKATPYIGETGEVANKESIIVNETKIQEEEKLDGFFCLITSELDYDYSRIMSTYSQLWMIEESFRITKSDLDVRPIYVSSDEHIKGYFVETFVALLIIRILQYKMEDKKISAQRIIEALNSCNCNAINEDIIHIERIGGRNSFFYKKIKETNETKPTLNMIVDVIEDGSINTDEIKKEMCDQIQSDFIKIIETFKIGEPMMWMRKKHFETYLKNINFSTILTKIKKKPGRQK